MPNTPTHDLVTIVQATGLAGIGLVTMEPWLAPVALGALSGLLFSPDWDWDGLLVENRHSHRRRIITNKSRWGMEDNERVERRIYGKVIRRWPSPIRQWLQVYALIFSHRGVSHAPIVSTMMRVLWVGLPALPIAALMIGWTRFVVWFVLWFIGLCIADMTHIVLDKVVSGQKTV